MTLTIRPVEAEDYDAWDPLYKGYCDFYAVPTSVEKRRVVFDWLIRRSWRASLRNETVGLSPLPIFGRCRARSTAP